MKTERVRKLCLIAVLSCAVVALMYGGEALATQDQHAQKLCPVMGGKIDKSAYVDYEGKRVYFCCSGCKQTFLENPEKYVKQMESQGIVLEKAPKSETGENHQHGTNPAGVDSSMGHGTHHQHGESMH